MGRCVCSIRIFWGVLWVFWLWVLLRVFCCVVVIRVCCGRFPDHRCEFKIVADCAIYPLLEGIKQEPYVVSYLQRLQLQCAIYSRYLVSNILSVSSS